MGLNFTIDMTRGLGLGLGSSGILKVRFFGTPCRIQHLVIKICVCDLVQDVELLPSGKLLVADCACEAPQMEHLAITIMTRTL